MGLDLKAAALFGGQTPQPDFRGFQLDSAYQGREGLEMIEKALAEESPFTVAFVDVRMPPGWDGIETIERIWKLDEEIQTVICTAYSDYSADDVLKRLGITDRLLILKKPFDHSEILLLATTLNEKWHLARADATLTDVLAERAFEF